jgi:predicted Mrr-cat superfamily restriction endonuclease
MIRGGNRDQFVDFARDYDVSLLGFDGTPDFSSITSPDQLRRQVETNYPDRTRGTVTRFANEIANFVWKIEPGDLIIMPYRSGQRFLIGTAGTKRYWFDDERVPEASHFKSVHWQADIMREQLSPDIWAQVKSPQMTVKCLSVDDPEAILIPSAGVKAVSGSEVVEAIEGERRRVERDLLKRDKRIVETYWRQSLQASNGVGRCEACDYTHAERGMFDVHHLRPIALMAQGGRTKLDDLALLCPRCHRLAHLGTGSKPHSTATLRQILHG